MLRSAAIVFPARYILEARFADLEQVDSSSVEFDLLRTPGALKIINVRFAQAHDSHRFILVPTKKFPGIWTRNTSTNVKLV